MSTCPICDQGVLQTRTYGRDMQHKGVNLTVEGLQYGYCPDCSAEVTSPEQLDHNEKIVREAFIVERARMKREQDLLTGAEIRRVRELLGITQKQASKIFGGGPTAFAKYEAEDVVQSAGMDKLLRVAAEVPAAASWLFKHAGISFDHFQVSIAPHAFSLKDMHPVSSAKMHQTIMKGLFVEEDGIKVGRYIWDAATMSSNNEGVYADAA